MAKREQLDLFERAGWSSPEAGVTAGAPERPEERTSLEAHTLATPRARRLYRAISKALYYPDRVTDAEESSIDDLLEWLREAGGLD